MYEDVFKCTNVLYVDCQRHHGPDFGVKKNHSYYAGAAL